MLALTGCVSLITAAFAHPIDENSPNAMKTGMIIESLKGHKYYFASGKCTVYAGILRLPQNNLMDSFAILVDEDTGRIIRILVLQPVSRAEEESHTYGSQGWQTTKIYGDYRYAMGELLGWASIDDIHYTVSWEEAQDLVWKFGVQI